KKNVLGCRSAGGHADLPQLDAEPERSRRADYGICDCCDPHTDRFYPADPPRRSRLCCAGPPTVSTWSARDARGRDLGEKIVARVGYQVINEIADVQIPRNTGDV